MPKNEAPFGLDISSNSLKLLQFQGLGKSRRVRGFAHVTATKDLIVNEAITDPKTFGFLLHQAMDKPQYGHFHGINAVVNLPESKSFVRVIQIPRMGEAEADNAVPFEAENFIPLPIDQVYLDWQKIGDQDDKMNILMIATPKDYIDSFLQVLDGTGIRVVALEVESVSCQRSLIAAGSNETVLIIDLDANRSSLIMIENGNLQFTSTVPIAGQAFTDSIATSLGIAAAKAEIIKKKVGIDNTSEYPNIKTVLMPILSNLTAEVRNILKFHSEHSENQVSRILLAGGSAQLKNLPEYLASQFADMPELKIELANPWINLPGITPPLDPLPSLSFATAIGLALRV